MKHIGIAVDMERRGLNLYRRARELAVDPSMQKLLDWLITQEQEHLTFFRLLYAEAAAEAEAAGEDVSGALDAGLAAEAMYLRGLMQVALDGALASPMAMLDEAIASERGAVAYYTGMLDKLGEDYTEALRLIIEEESNHESELLEMKDRMGREGAW